MRPARRTKARSLCGGRAFDVPSGPGDAIVGNGARVDPLAGGAPATVKPSAASPCRARLPPECKNTSETGVQSLITTSETIVNSPLRTCRTTDNCSPVFPRPPYVHKLSCNSSTSKDERKPLLLRLKEQARKLWSRVRVSYYCIVVQY